MGSLPAGAHARGRPQGGACTLGRVEARTADPAVGGLRFTGEWRRYQTLALEAFERDVAARPPEDAHRRAARLGQDALGLELVRRLGAPALVLVPNSAIQAQWLKAGGRVRRGAGHRRARTPSAPSPCLTYQALTQLDDPADALGELAERRWAAERADGARASPPSESTRTPPAWTGEAAPSAATASSPGSPRRSSARSPAASTARCGSPTCFAPARARAASTRSARRRRHRRPRRVPPPRLALGLRRAGGRRGARRRRTCRADGDAARRADRARRRSSTRRCSAPVDFTVPTPGGRARRLPRALPGARVADRAARLGAAVARRARPPLPRSS